MAKMQCGWCLLIGVWARVSHSGMLVRRVSSENPMVMRMRLSRGV